MLPVGSPRIQYLFWQWSRDRKIRTSLPHPWIFLNARKLVTSQSSNEVDFSSLCYHWPAGHILAFLLGATHRPFPHSCKQRHQVEARVQKMQWFVWNCPLKPRPHFFVFAHWSAMREGLFQEFSLINSLRWNPSVMYFLRVDVRKFYACSGLCKITAVYESSRVNVKVEPHSTFTLTWDFHTLLQLYLRVKNIKRRWKSTLRRLTVPYVFIEGYFIE